MTNIQTILNDKELAKALDATGRIITPWSIRNWRLQGGMPFFQVGKRIFYRLESVLCWIDSRESRTQNPAPVQCGTLRKIN